MEFSCNITVDINGEEIFMVNKEILALFSGKFRKLFTKSKENPENVVFNQFPGGAEGFELMARFCYNNGRIQISPSNIVQLNEVARFMEMDGNQSGIRNLIEQTEKSLEGISFWTWSELVEALKQCQEIVPAIDMEFSLVQKILDSVAGKIGLPNFDSSFSSENSSFRFSCESNCQSNWWFNDVLFLNIDLVSKLVNTMVSKKLDHFMISRFILCYQKFKFLGTNSFDKQEIMEGVINLFSLLEKTSISFKILFEIFRVCLTLKVSKMGRKKMEFLIGSRLDEATLDYLLIQSPNGKFYMYDVNLILRFVKAFFLQERCGVSSSQLHKLSCLIDSYLVEISPDIHLKPSKFAKLVKAIPDFARISHNQLYLAMDLYLEVHPGLCKDDKLKVCGSLKYEKLSAKVLKHLEGNSKFPSKPKVQSPITHQFNEANLGKKDEGKRIIVYAKKLDNSTNSDKLIAQYQDLQRKVMELEKVCRMKQTRIQNSIKPRISSHNNGRLPKLCLC